LIDVPRRRLTAQEDAWVREIVSANPDWADLDLGELFVIGQCTCGCRTVIFEEPPFVQNPKFLGRQDIVGQIDIHIRAGDKEDWVLVLLHYTDGKLTYLEVVWHYFPEPVPKSWTEISREVRAGH
jgi:hypothetical protein